MHGRTRACHYGVPAEYETLRAIRESVEIPLIANGDIATAAQARRVLDYTGADAIMIGRAARGRPWIFRDIADALTAGAAPQAIDGAATDAGTLPADRPPPPDWIRDILIAHLDALYRCYGAHGGVRIARKHIAWYCRHLPGAARFRDEINQAETPADQIARALAFFRQCPDVENNENNRQGTTQGNDGNQGND